MKTAIEPSVQDPQGAPEDLQEAARAGRPVRAHGPYRIQIGNADLEYRSAVIDDPKPTGEQILNLIGARPPEEHLVYQVLRNGELDDLRPTETTDLRERGVERFLVFKGSAAYRIELDGRVLEWGAPGISGLVLKKLAQVEPTEYSVWMRARRGDDPKIGDTELVKIGVEGLERFYTGKSQSTEG